MGGILMNNKITGKKIIGAKQTIKAISNNSVSAVYVAKDADIKVVKPIIELCQEKNIEIVYIASMQELGKLCSIDVGAATACVLSTDGN
jgi:large subunit ribosomal protein L7A